MPLHSPPSSNNLHTQPQAFNYSKYYLFTYIAFHSNQSLLSPLQIVNSLSLSLSQPLYPPPPTLLPRAQYLLPMSETTQI